MTGGKVPSAPSVGGPTLSRFFECGEDEWTVCVRVPHPFVYLCFVLHKLMVAHICLPLANVGLQPFPPAFGDRMGVDVHFTHHFGFVSGHGLQRCRQTLDLDAGLFSPGGCSPKTFTLTAHTTGAVVYFACVSIRPERGTADRVRLFLSSRVRIHSWFWNEWN